MDLYQSLGTENVADVVRRSRLRWFGHVERENNDDWVTGICMQIPKCGWH